MMMAVMCGNNPVPGACSGCSKSEPHERGVVACTLLVNGTERPCQGDWDYWPDEPRYSLSLRTTDFSASSPSSAKVSLFEYGGTGPDDLTFESYPLGAKGRGELVADAWIRGAGDYGSHGAGPVGALHLSKRVPPLGTFSATLAPEVDPEGHISSWSGPPGTTVSIEASFVGTTH
jgi:hypothetical protein